MLRRAALALVLGTALALTSTAPAVAARLVERDRTTDVWRYPADGSEPVAAPGIAAGDVRRLVVKHVRDEILVRQFFVKLRRGGPLTSYRVELRTPRGVYREVQVDASRRIGWRGRARVFNRAGARVSCTVRHRLDYEHGRVVVRLGRGCLDRPHYVGARSTSLWLGSTGDLLVDNPHTTSHEAAWTGWVSVG